VLELGSSSTSTLSSSLPASTNYLYTCKNASLLSVAKSKLQTSQHSTDFKTLDIEKPLESQDFAGQDFDVVVAYNIFSGGKDTIKALTNAKKLLKEGGKLCLVEATSPGVAAVSDLGGFSRWWRYVLSPVFPSFTSE
jgi:pyochelin synthetase